MSILRGREGELALLTERLCAAAAGQGSIALLYGEAGIGKSTLASAAAERAQQAGFRVESGRALELTLAPAWFPLRACLKALSIEAQADSEQAAFGLWESVLEALSRTTASQPVLWYLEDLHAADAQTLDLLRYLAHPAKALRFMVLGTVRAKEPRIEPAAEERLARLTRDALRIDLGPLDNAAIGELVSQILGHPLDSKAIAAWNDRTGGNPLFIVECARSLRGQRGSAPPLPATVVQVVLERLAALPGETRALLERGAVLGRDFSASTVARMSGALPAAAIDGLLPALKSGLLSETSPGSFRFSHALICEAILGALGREQRREAHAQAESALAALGDTPERLVARAWHALDGLGAVPEPRAAAIVRAAIALLEQQGAYDRAYALWLRWAELGSTAPSHPGLIEGARLATLAGDYRGARAHSEAALALARAAQGEAGEAVARAALALGADLTPGLVDQRLVRALEEATTLLAETGGDPALRCRVKARLAAAQQPAREPQLPVEMARAAIAEARRLGEPGLIRETLFVASAALTEYVDAAEIKRLADELLERSLEAGDNERALRAHIRRALAQLELGDIPAFQVDADRIVATARNLGHPRLLWRPLILGSLLALMRGRFADSERLLEEVEELRTLTDDPALAETYFAHRSLRLLAIDDRAGFDQLWPVLNQHLEALPDANTAGPMVRALFALRFNERERVKAELPQLFRLWPRMPPSAGYLGIAGEAAALCGSSEACAHLHALLRSSDGRENHTGHIPYTYEGPIARVLALLEAAMGQTETAEQRLTQVIERLRAQNLEPWLARCLVDQAQLVTAAGRRSAAEPALQEALELARALSMRSLLARAEAMLPAGPPSLPPAVTSPSAVQPPLMVTREGELWRVQRGALIARLKDSRGMEMLERLVAHPGARIHALVLVGGEEVAESDAGELLDAAALKAYRARLAAISADLEEAERDADLGRQSGLRREREAIEDELARAVGLGGKVRRAASATERARVNATRRIKDAIARVKEAEPRLGEHLESAIRTGTYSCYRP